MKVSILIDDYMMNTDDDERVINFLKSELCSIDMVNYQDNDGWCALNLAARLNRHEVVKALIEKGADVNRINWDHSFNPLMFCIYEGDNHSEEDKENKLKTVKLLIDANTNLNFEDRFSAFTLACQVNETEVIKLLLQYNINIDFKDEDGQSGLDYLKEHYNQEAINMVNSYVMHEKLNTELNQQNHSNPKLKI